MHEIIPPALNKLIHQQKLIAVLVIDNLDQVRPLMSALQEAGIGVLELTLRTPVAIKAISIIKKEFPDFILGAGTVLTVEQLYQVQEGGADFAVAPGLNPKILEEAIIRKIPFFPGVMTPSEIALAISFGCRVLKFFPAGAVGGLNFLKTANAAYTHLGLKYIPLGGVNTDNLAEYTSSPIIHAVGGSWLAPLPLIQEGNWTQIKRNVTHAISIIATPT